MCIIHRVLIILFGNSSLNRELAVRIAVATQKEFCVIQFEPWDLLWYKFPKKKFDIFQ